MKMASTFWSRDPSRRSDCATARRTFSCVDATLISSTDRPPSANVVDTSAGTPAPPASVGLKTETFATNTSDGSSWLGSVGHVTARTVVSPSEPRVTDATLVGVRSVEAASPAFASAAAPAYISSHVGCVATEVAPPPVEYTMTAVASAEVISKGSGAVPPSAPCVSVGAAALTATRAPTMTLGARPGTHAYATTTDLRGRRTAKRRSGLPDASERAVETSVHLFFKDNVNMKLCWEKCDLVLERKKRREIN